MTTTTPPDIRADIRELQRMVANLGGKVQSFSVGIKMLPDGLAHFPGGISVGGSGADILRMLSDVPPPTNLGINVGAHEDGVVYADLTWDNPAGYGQEQVTQYEVTAVKSGEPWPITMFVKRSADPAQSGGRLEPLQPDSSYNVSVQSMAGLRHSVGLTGVINTLHDDVPPAAPVWSASPVTAGIQSLALQWEDNTEPDVVNFAGGYRVRIFKVSDDSVVKDYKVAQSFSVATGLPTEPLYIILNAIDSSGNESADSAAENGTPSGVVTTDLAFTIGGGNVATNSGFEFDSNADNFPDNYTIDAGSISNTQGFYLDTTNRYKGSKSLKIQAATAADYYAHQDFSIPKAGRYTISVWVDRNAVTAVTGAGSGINIDAAAGSVTPVVAWDGGGQLDQIYAGTIAWRREWVVVDVTNNTTVRVYFQQGYGGTCTGTTRFDAWQIEEGDIPTAWAPRPDEIGPGTITATEVADDAITTPKLAAFAIVASKIAANTIGAAQIAARAITANEIATATITANEIAVDTIIANNIAANAITTTELAANAVTATKIAAGTITADRFSADVALINQQIRSTDFVAPSSGGGSGWRLYTDGGGAGYVEATNGVFRNIDTYGMTLRGVGEALQLNAGRLDGSVIVLDTGGYFLVSGKFYVDPTLPRIECVANINIGYNYSGGVYAMDSSFNEDVNWGMSIDHPSGTQYHTKIRYTSVSGSSVEQRAGVYDMNVGWAFFADQFTSCQARTTWGVFSSEEIKNRITMPRVDDLALRLLAVKPRNYYLNENDDWRKVPRLGFVLEEIAPLFPEIVGPTGDTIAISDLVPACIAAIQRLASDVATLQQQVAALEPGGRRP